MQLNTLSSEDLIESARSMEDENDVVRRWRKLVDANRWDGLVDEAEVYRALGLGDHSAET